MCYIDHTSSTASYVDITQIKYPPRGGGGGRGKWSFWALIFGTWSLPPPREDKDRDWIMRERAVVLIWGCGLHSCSQRELITTCIKETALIYCRFVHIICSEYVLPHICKTTRLRWAWKDINLALRKAENYTPLTNPFLFKPLALSDWKVQNWNPSTKRSGRKKMKPNTKFRNGLISCYDQLMWHGRYIIAVVNWSNLIQLPHYTICI